jgi:hypothetical protein
VNFVNIVSEPTIRVKLPNHNSQKPKCSPDFVEVTLFFILKSRHKAVRFAFGLFAFSTECYGLRFQFADSSCRASEKNFANLKISLSVLMTKFA